jgi:hypothetical protein
MIQEVYDEKDGTEKNPAKGIAGAISGLNGNNGRGFLTSWLDV